MRPRVAVPDWPLGIFLGVAAKELGITVLGLCDPRFSTATDETDYRQKPRQRRRIRSYGETH